ncbi:hypothetical protein B7P43_G06810 [Cryptotermes secundus]|uniref:Uncharacterized protein n=1 Tax=Cryptotermes secundus TaxID=105785 RepID=A0A2J7Q0M7_9NEOP|nr:hypothetical protein B7P43_G06810 [Cryptotermes secundus]
MLVQIVEQLEQETADRVSLLQEGLQRSSRAAHAYMTKVDDWDRDVTIEKNEEVLMDTQVKNLKNDITNLLEVIRRLREEHRWDTTGLTFTEVTADDIFGTQDLISGHFGGAVPDDQDKDAIIADLKAELLSLHCKLDRCWDEKGSEVSELKKEIVTLKEDNRLKEGQIQRFVRRIQKLHKSIHYRSSKAVIESQLLSTNAVSESAYDEFLTWCYELEGHHQKALQENTKLAEEIEQLKMQLKKRTAEAEELSKSVNDMDQSAKDMRAALTGEVADKHDRILALRREIQLLEERCRQADMQTHFKDDIIKEMRKDIKDARFKLAALHPDNEHDVVNGAQHLCQHPKDYQQVQVPVNNSNHQFQQVHISHDLSLPYQHLSTPENLNRTCSDGTAAEAQLQSVWHCNQFLENSHLPYRPVVTDDLIAEETYYEVCQRHSAPSRNVQVSTTDGSGHEGDTAPPQDVAVQGAASTVNTSVQQEPSLVTSGIQTEQPVLSLVTSEVQTEHSLPPEFSGDHSGSIVEYQNKARNGVITLDDVIKQIHELSYNMKAKENKITDQDAVIHGLQERVKTSQAEVKILKEKCEKYLQDIQKAEQNQADCERRIKELSDVLERSYTDLKDSLNSMDIGKNTTRILYSQDMKIFCQKYEESQETFKNLKAEFSYLLFSLKSHEKQVIYLGGIINSLNEILQRTQRDQEDVQSEMSIFSKEKESLQEDHEECQQKIERLEKSLKYYQEERQASYTKLETTAKETIDEALQEEHEKLKVEMEKLQSSLISREKVAQNQEEMINILQDSVNIAQKEQQDLQQKLKDAETEKEKLLNALHEEGKKAVNLQQALLATKQQLEDLQGNKYECSNAWKVEDYAPAAWNMK